MPPRGRFLERPSPEFEQTAFARDYGLECTIPPTPTNALSLPPAPDPRLLGRTRRAYRSRAFPEMIEVELLLTAKGLVEVAGLWIERRWLADRAQLPYGVTLYASFLADALADLPARETTAVGNLLAVSYDLAKTFEPLTRALPYVPQDAAGAGTEVFLGRRQDALQRVYANGAALALHNDPRGRFFVGVATSAAALDLDAMLFHSAVTYARGTSGGVLGWKAQEIEATPFGRRYGLEHDRATAPRGRIARHHYGLARIPGSVLVEVLLEPTRGLAGVLLRIDQDWMERTDANFFVALEVLAAFVAEGLGDQPDARLRVEIGDFLGVDPNDGDLLKVLHASLPFVGTGRTGPGLAVFLGEAQTAAIFLDEKRCGLMFHENADGWLDALFFLTEIAGELDIPVDAPDAPTG